MKRKAGEGSLPIVSLLIYLLLAYVATGLILLVLALLLYKWKLSVDIINGGIVFTYVAASFLAGFLTGKRLKQKKFLWGLLMGVTYFVVLLVVSLVANKGFSGLSGSALTTLVLCAGGGMLGGMIS